MPDPNDFIMMPVPVHQFAAVCALLGGVAPAAIASGGAGRPQTIAEPAPAADGPIMHQGGASDAAAPSDGASAGAASDDGALDTAGWPWDPALHASTKGTTKEGLWRMKVGVSRPDPKPGYPKSDAAPNGGTGTTSDGAASPSSGTASSAPAGEDEDEFAAFRAAADAANGTDAAAAASVPARKWTDADLGALCNQAAVKLGDPAPVKELIGSHVPEGQVPHSRNIPEDQREAFAKAVEAKAGITFAG